MKKVFLRVLPSVAVALGAMVLFSSCTVDEDAAFLVKSAETGNASKKKKADAAKKKEKPENSWAEQRKAKEAERKAAAEERKKELAEKRAKAAAEKEKAAEEKAKALAAKKKQEEREELAEKKKAADEARAKRIADAREKAAKIKADRAAKKKAEELAASRDTDTGSRRRSGGGFGNLFAGLGGGGTPSEYKSKGHDVYINRRALGSLNESNSKIEIDLSDQKARIYKTGAGGQELVIETKVSTGKSGHSTSPGTFRIKEKLVEKRSTLYGRWVNSSGQTIPSAGEVGSRPSGASQFIGASMPYWMRINGGIGMHIGYVPEYPASHGCIRVPSAVQPLIFSKVGVGTTVAVVQ